MYHIRFLTAAFFCAVRVQADGNGLIGWGKTMYSPPCAFACRTVIKSCELLCTPKEPTENHGTAHSPVATPPECFTTDPAFMQTMAVCIDTYCSWARETDMDLIEDYWASHLGTNTVGNHRWKPAVSYRDALAAGREDEHNAASGGSSNSTEHHHQIERNQSIKHQHSHGTTEKKVDFSYPDVQSALPMAVKGAPLNVTSFVNPQAWQKAYNGMTDFETNEAGHSTFTITVMLVAILLPIPLSLLRFVPCLSETNAWSYLNSLLAYPAVWGSRHRDPVGSIGLVPSRGQALYIALISFLNVIFLLAPYVHTHPQTTFVSLKMQEISTIGNRAGSMAMGNAAAMFLFAARNNILLWVTDWSYGTYQMLHRWLGYWTIIHTIIHSFMLLANYKIQGTYEDELIREYWIWGIVATVAVSIILPTSMLVVRQKLYELFLVVHILLALLFIIGYYYHIWYCYQYNWGYEIWAYIVGAIWGLDRVLRLARMGARGLRTATVSEVPGSNGEYLRVHVDGVRMHGVAYLCFPTLGWRFWESHPFSAVPIHGSAQVDEEVAPARTISNEKAPMASAAPTTSQASSQTDQALATFPGATFYVRTRTGVTSKLASRLVASKAPSVSVKVLVEGSYHSNASSQLKHCGSILCIAGGVGITATLPYVQKLSVGGNARLVWGTRSQSLVTAMAPELGSLPETVQVDTVVGQRLDISAILRKEMTWSDKGDKLLGIVVCGPAGMADEVRRLVTLLARDAETRRPFVLVDEAFSW